MNGIFISCTRIGESPEYEDVRFECRRRRREGEPDSDEEEAYGEVNGGDAEAFDDHGQGGLGKMGERRITLEESSRVAEKEGRGKRGGDV
jgi:hypothetical protein